MADQTAKESIADAVDILRDAMHNRVPLPATAINCSPEDLVNIQVMGKLRNALSDLIDALELLDGGEGE